MLIYFKQSGRAIISKMKSFERRLEYKTKSNVDEAERHSERHSKQKKSLNEMMSPGEKMSVHKCLYPFAAQRVKT